MSGTIRLSTATERTYVGADGQFLVADSSKDSGIGFSNLSADEIAALLGFADAATMVAAINAGGAIADISDWPSGLSATELGYVNGVTSAIQTQLDNKSKLIIHALRITSNQTGLSGSSAVNTVILNSIPTNLGGYFTESSGIWTCAIACTVRIRAQIYQATSTTGNTVCVYKDSTPEAVEQPSSGMSAAVVMAVEKVLSFTVGQTFKVTVSSTAAPAVGFGDGLSWLQVTLEAA